MNADPTPGSPSAQRSSLAITGSSSLVAWLLEHRLSLSFTTYQAGKVFLIGVQPDGRLSVFERTFNRCMGLWADGQTMWLSSLYQVWRFENVLDAGQLANGYDRLYVPQVGYTTGDLDTHDLAVGGGGQVVFVNTLFGCLATLSERASFVPLWRPPFLSRLAAEDRCHLNGVALVDGSARYVTVVSQSDVADGWRDHRRDGGCVIDVQSNETVCTGLSMPHSPRVHSGKLWLLDSGSGFLGTVAPHASRFDPAVFLPGYLRGLAFVGDFAVVGLSKPRQDRTFSGLVLDENLAARRATARCGLYIVDLRSMEVAHWLRIEGIVSELYDVAVLPGVRRPTLLGFKTDEIQRTISIGEADQGRGALPAKS